MPLYLTAADRDPALGARRWSQAARDASPRRSWWPALAWAWVAAVGALVVAQLLRGDR